MAVDRPPDDLRPPPRRSLVLYAVIVVVTLICWTLAIYGVIRMLRG